VNYSEGGLAGPATLTITGNEFTLTPEGGSPVNGRVSAVTTRGYTGVAMQLGSVAPATPGTPAAPPPPSLSLRAKKSGSNLTLSSVPGESRQFSFSPAKGGRKSKKSKSTAAATATPAAAETPTTSSMTEDTSGNPNATTSSRHKSRGKKNSKANSNTGGAMNTNNSNQ
jgi:hypothetical protein